MDKQIVSLFLVFAGMMALLGCVTGVAITYLKFRSHRLAPPGVSGQLDEIVERLARLENSLDATAVEVERISEGQRFTTKLLADRDGVSPFADRPRGGSTTPH